MPSNYSIKPILISSSLPSEKDLHPVCLPGHPLLHQRHLVTASFLVSALPGSAPYPTICNGLRDFHVSLCAVSMNGIAALGSTNTRIAFSQKVRLTVVHSTFRAFKNARSHQPARCRVLWHHTIFRDLSSRHIDPGRTSVIAASAPFYF